MSGEPIDDGGPAFPPDLGSQFKGMTLRDYFASQALAGICAYGCRKFEDAASDAYGFADAMLAERKRGAGEA